MALRNCTELVWNLNLLNWFKQLLKIGTKILVGHSNLEGVENGNTLFYELYLSTLYRIYGKKWYGAFLTLLVECRLCK